MTPSDKVLIADVVVIGAGIAGASVAAALAEHFNVVLLEMESQPGYHTTGRSAAVFAQSYGPRAIRALTRASRSFFMHPPEGFAPHPLISPRPILMVARSDQEDSLANLIADLSSETPIERLNAAGLCNVQPLLRKDYGSGGMLDTSGQDIDVNALHQGYLRSFRQQGGVLRTNSTVSAIEREGTRWRIETTGGEVSASIAVNAAGAWAQQIGEMAGAERIGLIPKRRTALIVPAPAGQNCDGFPITIDIDEEFYLKPDAGRLLISPADETPTEPCDVQPEELDVAICIDRITTAFDLTVRRIENKWAGLRSFVSDKSPVVGFSTVSDRFYWLAGQGGYGIQTAPAVAAFAAANILGRTVPSQIRDAGFDPQMVAPSRLAT